MSATILTDIHVVEYSQESLELADAMSILGQVSNNGTKAEDCVAKSLLPDTVSMAATPLLAWAAMVLMGTMAAKSPLRTLSLERSWKELTTARASRLSVLDVFRVVAIVWVMLNHTGSEGRVDILNRAASADSFKHAVHTHPVLGALLGNSALGVEVFLVLSGLLGARSWLREAASAAPFWPRYRAFVGRRVLRLAPSVGVFVFVAAGPLMQAALPLYSRTMVSACGLRGVLAHLTFAGNWQSTPTCMGYLWYLGLDMQLHLALPFLMQAMARAPLAGGLLGLALVLASGVARGVHCALWAVCNKSDVDIPFIAFPDLDAAVVQQMYAGLWDLYARPHTKCGPFIVGALLGYATLYAKTEWSAKLSQRVFAWGALTCIAVIYGILPEYWYPEMQTNLYNLAYTSAFRTVFAVGICAMIAACHFKAESIAVHPAWGVLARLTFGAYLLHMPIVYVFNHLAFLQSATSALALLVVLPAVALLSFAAAAVFYLFVEAPAGRLSAAFAAVLGL